MAYDVSLGAPPCDDRKYWNRTIQWLMCGVGDDAMLRCWPLDQWEVVHGWGGNEEGVMHGERTCSKDAWLA